MYPALDIDHWTARDLFDLLAELGPLRVISQSGPSTFETICQVKSFAISHGMLNAFTPQYHWHLDLTGLRHVRTRDEIHSRTGRRMLSFDLRTSPDAAPFVIIELHREMNMPFDYYRLRLFSEMHVELGAGVPVGVDDAEVPMAMPAELRA